MINIAICDDEKIYVDLIYNCMTNIMHSKSIGAKISKYQNSEELLAAHEKKHFDVLFLDIDMPVASGFDVSKVVRDISGDTYIIFVSAIHELVYNSFEYNPFYFICKTDQANLFNDLEKVTDKLILHFQQHRKITVNDTTIGPVVVSLQNIVYIKSDKHYLKYYMSNRVEPYVERGSLKDKEEELDSPDFIKPHQRYLVNMNRIVKFSELTNIIAVDNTHSIPISKSLKEASIKAYLIYKRR